MIPVTMAMGENTPGIDHGPHRKHCHGNEQHPEDAIADLTGPAEVFSGKRRKSRVRTRALTSSRSYTIWT